MRLNKKIYMYKSHCIIDLRIGSRQWRPDFTGTRCEKCPIVLDCLREGEKERNIIVLKWNEVVYCLLKKFF